jgi:uncharacterized SAM-binding protein YcdF (DUF218 family)
MASVALIVLTVVVAGALLERRHAWPRGRRIWGWAAVCALLALATLLSPGEFELRKFVGGCLMPAGLVWLGLLAFTCLLARRTGRRFAGAALALWLLYTLAGNAWLGSFALKLLGRQYATVDSFGQGRFDAVLVLGGGVEVGDDGSPTLTSAGDRIVLAVRLYRAGKTPLLLTTGPYLLLPGGAATSSAAATAAIWRQLGVPEESIVLMEGPRTTTDEVLALKAAAAERGWQRVGVLTSAWHLPRAMRLCRRYGVAAVPLPADAVATQPPRLRWLVPQQDGFQSVQTACWEILGALAGR